MSILLRGDTRADSHLLNIIKGKVKGYRVSNRFQSVGDSCSCLMVYVPSPRSILVENAVCR